MDMASLQTLLNRFALGYDGAPLKNVRVTNDGGRLEMKGTLHKGVDVPFSAKATLSATPDGRMQLHVDSMKAIGIPAKGLLGLFGLELDDLVKLKNSRGIEVQENDIVIDPGEILPPPEMRGRDRQDRAARRSTVPDVRQPRRQARGPAHAPRSLAAQLHLLQRRGHPVRQADDARRRPTAHRQRSSGSV